MNPPEVILAIDPGRQKCGLVVGQAGAVLARAVVASDQVGEVARAWAERFAVKRVLLGRGTGSETVRQALAAQPGLPRIEAVEEMASTLEARRRYFRDHPPRGWRRLLPLSLQVPPEEYDDYAAELLLERVHPRPAGLGEGD